MPLFLVSIHFNTFLTLCMHFISWIRLLDIIITPPTRLSKQMQMYVVWFGKHKMFQMYAIKRWLAVKMQIMIPSAVIKLYTLELKSSLNNTKFK